MTSNFILNRLNQSLLSQRVCWTVSGIINTKRCYHQGTSSQDKQKQWIFISGAAVVGGSALLLYNTDILKRAHAATATKEELQPPIRPDLPTYKLEDVRKHGKESNRIWVTFQNGVYDITQFIESHPGGDKILMAAGGSLEPFWALYAQHKTKEVLEILETLRIGNIDPEEVIKASVKAHNVDDPFSGDPLRHPALKVNAEKPFNAESPPLLLVESFLTPNPLFFIRNHLPVPRISPNDHHLKVEGIGITKPISLSVEDLKEKFQTVSVTSAIQCAGNRRASMNEYKKVQGLMWDGTAISNAKWTGVRLRDILILAGIDPNDKSIKHVHFEGADSDHTVT
uniref:sulfite oxidase n=1 Tax=Acrobeloides nanus TaxID=290746 RepID=A0A914CJ72_9BILA